MNRKRKNRKLPYSKRLAILYLVIGLLLCLCIGRAIVLVLKNGDEYRHRALQQSTASSSVILAQPGNILDANGTALAVSKRVYRLILDPKVLFDTEKSHKGSMEATVALVAKAFQLDEADLRKSFEENEKGCIREGQLADFVILSDNPFETDPGRLSGILVLETVLGGRCVYCRDQEEFL